MESTYTDIVEAINSKIEWHRAEITKLSTMVEQLGGEPSELVSLLLSQAAAVEAAQTEKKPAAKRTAKKSSAVKPSSNGTVRGGERKEQITELLTTTDMSVREIAEELGTHPNYVRTVKKSIDDSADESKPRRVVTRTSK